MTTTVHLAEDDESDHDAPIQGDHFTARFSGHVEADGVDPNEPDHRIDGADLDTALTWARERSPRVQVLVGSEDLYSAGEEPLPDLPPLPADLVLERHLAPWDTSRARTESDPPVAWHARVELVPPGYDGGLDLDARLHDLDAWGAVVRRAAAGWPGATVSDEEMRTYLDDAHATRRRGRDGFWGFGTSSAQAFVVTGSVDAASTAAQAEDQVRKLLADLDGWDVTIDVEPAGAD